jgi:molybdopterin molybdotransferase
VVPYEDLTESMALNEKPEIGQFIHERGHDAAAGQVLVNPGCRISSAEIAIAASVGKFQVEVYRLPIIAIITTGDEAIAVNQSPEPWQIRRSNGPMLEAALSRLGSPANFIAHVNDNPTEAAEIIHHALETCDVLILCGGISMGKKDYIRELLEEKLGAPEFHGVQLRPGKPLAYWKGAPQVFALPGNPVSVLATFTRFVIPTLMKIQGLTSHSALRISMENVSPLPKFTWLLTVAPDTNGVLQPRPPRNSGDYVSIAGAIGIVEVPPQPDFTSAQSLSFYPFP